MPVVDNSQLYRKMYEIRRFEETVLDNFPRGIFTGTTHTYIGQEANAVGILSQLTGDDIVFSNHRCHGHFLAYGGDPRRLFAELMGKVSGVCGGRGGSQHLQWRNFYSNGVQGGIVPVATGMALAEKIKQTGAISIVFLGDGTLGEGVIYETFNMAALWGAPVLYVVENNHIAQTTPTKLVLAGDIEARFQAFGISTSQVETSDVLALQTTACQILEHLRTTPAPQALIIHTQRFGPHSKGDDTRLADQIKQLRELYDPLRIHAPRLDPALRAQIEAEVNDLIEQAFHLALQDPQPKTLSDDNWAPLVASEVADHD